MLFDMSIMFITSATVCMLQRVSMLVCQFKFTLIPFTTGTVNRFFLLRK